MVIYVNVSMVSIMAMMTRETLTIFRAKCLRCSVSYRSCKPVHRLLHWLVHERSIISVGRRLPLWIVVDEWGLESAASASVPSD